MAGFWSKAAAVLLATSAAAVSAEPGVVSMPMRRLAPRSTIQKRAAGTQTVTLGNAFSNGLYYVNASVGTPPQTVQLQIDTGSSDIWFFGAQAYSSCKTCAGGDFDPAKSSSYQLLAQGQFQIQYVTPGSGVVGDYISDTFSIGQLSLKNLTMAVASQAQAVTTGIMGIGYDSDESLVSNGGQAYPNLIDELVAQGIINTRAYSLYLDDLHESTGTILFGGYDTAKYTGELTVLPIQVDSQSGAIDSFNVVWSGMALADSTGTFSLGGSGDFPTPAVLDSGTTLTIVPEDVFTQLADYFGVVNDTDYGFLVNCNMSNKPGAIEYQFGGNGGPVIVVPFSELAIPLYTTKGKPLTFKNGQQACQFGFDIVSQGSPILLGDTFLRSAYVVYDLDANAVAIANAAYDKTNSNIVQIGGSGSAPSSVLSIPSATTAYGATVTQTATGLYEPGIGFSATGGTSATDTIATAANGGAGHLSGASPTSLTSAYGLDIHGVTGSTYGPSGAAATGSAASGSAASATSSKGAAAGLPRPAGGLGGVVLAAGGLAALMAAGAWMVVA